MIGDHVRLYSCSDSLEDLHQRLGYLAVTDLTQYRALPAEIKSPMAISKLAAHTKSAHQPPPCIALVQTKSEPVEVMHHAANHGFKGCNISTLKEILKEKSKAPSDGLSQDDCEHNFVSLSARCISATLGSTKEETARILMANAEVSQWEMPELLQEGTVPEGFLSQDHSHDHSTADGSKGPPEE